MKYIINIRIIILCIITFFSAENIMGQNVEGNTEGNIEGINIEGNNLYGTNYKYPISIFDPETKDSLYILEAWLMRFYQHSAEENILLTKEVLSLYEMQGGYNKEITLLEQELNQQERIIEILTITNQSVVGRYNDDAQLGLIKLLGGQNQINKSIKDIKSHVKRDPKWMKWGGFGLGVAAGILIKTL